jgi:hypothetical protein
VASVVTQGSILQNPISVENFSENFSTLKCWIKFYPKKHKYINMSKNLLRTIILDFKFFNNYNHKCDQIRFFR